MGINFDAFTGPEIVAGSSVKYTLVTETSKIVFGCPPKSNLKSRGSRTVFFIEKREFSKSS